MAGLVRIWRQPSRAMRGATLDRLTPRGRWLLEQSRTRFERRPDAYLSTKPMFPGEIGQIDSFRVIVGTGAL